MHRIVELALTVKDQSPLAPTTLRTSREIGVQTRLAVTFTSPRPFGVVQLPVVATAIVASAGSPWALTAAVIPAVSVGRREP
jgi:hypothetical protein